MALKKTTEALLELKEIMWGIKAARTNMANYYLDIETQGLDPEADQIITIQFQKLDWDTGEPVGDLTILKAWDSSEKEILEKFQIILGESQWDFVAHGYCLGFEDKFLRERSIACGLEKPIRLFDRPTVDLHSVGILMNGGSFKGSGLDKITGKKNNGLACLTFYNLKKYDKVTNYIKQETEEYLEFYSWLRQRMPKLMTEFHADCL
ncbi:hypothetical protein LCGC14_0442180 [marine sediment metagenome]|uniref:Uncharacterized protein n=1 Tax=marine sediment metagenome TaxID=412755 RepID=A0A0F9VUF6_9ZZZZ